VRKNVGISSLTDSGAVVTIADPRFVHRITGGTVKAERGKKLRRLCRITRTSQGDPQGLMA
jgi:hypothetical protein